MPSDSLTVPEAGSTVTVGAEGWLPAEVAPEEPPLQAVVASTIASRAVSRISTPKPYWHTLTPGAAAAPRAAPAGRSRPAPAAASSGTRGRPPRPPAPGCRPLPAVPRQPPRRPCAGAPPAPRPECRP